MNLQTTESATRSHDGALVPVAGSYELDVAHSHVGFSVRHLMVSRVRGQFRSFRGTLTIAEDPAASDVTVEIDAASIDTRDEQRDGHLRSPDFRGRPQTLSDAFPANRAPAFTMTAQRDRVGSPSAHQEHVGHANAGEPHADHAGMFRDRFWVCLVLTVPVVLY